MIKRVLKWICLGVGVILVGAAGFVGYHVWQYERSFTTVYDIPLPKIERSTDPAVLERGKHLAESIGGCAVADCHGNDLGGGRLMEMGPLGIMQGPNMTRALARYSDGELARIILHGVKRDGTAARFMPSKDFSWWPDDDLQAVISYVRTLPVVEKPDGPISFGTLAKVLDRLGKLEINHARRIDHTKRDIAPKPEPTAVYGGYVGRLCLGCHGVTLSGGPIPGAPPSLPVPLNLTPHETGLKGWTYEDFDKLLLTGIRKNGNKLDPFMPFESFSKMNEVEKKAIFAFLMAQPARPFGGR